MKKSVLLSLMMVTGLIISVGVPAGDLDPSFGPQSGSGMYTLSEVYYYLTEGTEGTIATSFQEPAAGPGPTMMDTKVIYEDIETIFNSCTASPATVLTGVPFFSTDTSAWGMQTGTYSGGGGTGLPKTGQFVSYLDYDDAWYANPAPGEHDIGNPQGTGSWANYTAEGGRFSTQTSGLPGGVVLDNATGLSWATGTDGAGCNFGAQTDWTSAVAWASNIDFATQTDWRLPNYHELTSIVDQSTTSPAIDTRFFSNTFSHYYWSSTTYAGGTTYAWRVYFRDGFVSSFSKAGVYYVRAVRGGE